MPRRPATADPLPAALAAPALVSGAPPAGYHLQFASDNTAGVCPEALAAFAQANTGFAASYGNDDATHTVCDRLREVFEADAEVFFVFNGTAANSTALAALCQSYQAVVCSDTAHVHTDECGAPEFFSGGSKLLTVPARQGKLTTAGLTEAIERRSDIHYPRARAVTLTQSTEQGTLYQRGEISGLARVAHAHGMKVHMDGARFANAVASLGCAPADITWRAGVDVLCLGGTKMGLPVGEAILFFDRQLGADFAYRAKQAGQLASKMRFVSSPWLAMLEGGTWLRHAGHANAMAHRLAEKVAALPGAELLLPPEANGVFVSLPEAAIARLRAAGWAFYTFIGGGARFMCSWATTPEAVDHLAHDIGAALAAG
ncbi:threonine aldolase family protein [Ideonella livida]|uniref:L-threonine aldolase n=1 Tax=Ideonella livida TaxID=2707176 RepID=A0A7C9TLI9_9BURK|nr:low specificity L-threonine aldolase [Ideonella livida]NDY92504.1 low specificity L-threonine aldolase [Ideonella livida]